MEQIELLKERHSRNECDSSVSNELMTQVNTVQNEENVSEVTMTLTSLRKAMIRQINENDECNTSTFKRHLHITQIAGRPKKFIDKDALEHMKNIGMSNVDIAKFFTTDENRETILSMLIRHQKYLKLQSKVSRLPQ